MANNEWAKELRAQLKAEGGSGLVKYLKDGETLIKLLLPEGVDDPRGFYQEYTTTYQDGKQGSSYLITGVILASDTEGLADKTKIVYIQVPKTVLLLILDQIANDWDLFDNPGNPVIIRRTKNGKKTDYGISPLKKTFDASVLTYPEQTIDEAATEEAARTAERVSEAKETPAPAAKKKAAMEDLI